MKEIEADQKHQKFTTGLDHRVQPILQDKGNIHGSEINEKPRTVSIRVPVRAHQHIIQRQQYYTGDA